MKLLFPCTVQFLVLPRNHAQYQKASAVLLKDWKFKSTPEGVCYSMSFFPGDQLHCLMRHIQDAQDAIKESLAYALQGGGL